MGHKRTIMKTQLKIMASASALVLLSSLAGTAFAHTQSGSLAAAAGSIDYYRVTCSTDGVATQRLDIKVRDKTAGAGGLSVQVKKGNIARNSTDPVGSAAATDATFSPLVTIASLPPPATGNGVYDVFVDKTSATARNYILDFHCMNGAVHTGTGITSVQNQ
jgi:hypothetical protein